MAIRIFISYRRADSTTTTGRIYDRLIPVFGKNHVFRDIDNMKAGKDFRGQINETLNTSDIVLVIIGRSWLTTPDKTGKPRLEDPADFVRLEIEAALARDYIPVIPVLVDGATMPSADQLPVSLRELAFKHALEIRHDPDFHNDIDRLIRKIRELLPKAPSRWYLGLIGLTVMLVLGGFLAIALSNRGNDETPPNTPETNVAQQPSDTPNPEQNETAIAAAIQEQTRLAATATPEPTETLSPTPTESPEPTETQSPSPSPEEATNTLTVAEEAQATFSAISTQNQATTNVLGTEQAGRDRDATNTVLPLTQVAEETQAIQTQQAGGTARAIEVATQVSVLQATETTWTPTHTATFTPSATHTNTQVPIPTHTPTDTSTATLTRIAPNTVTATFLPESTDQLEIASFDAATNQEITTDNAQSLSLTDQIEANGIDVIENPIISPDGKWIAFIDGENQLIIWEIDRQRILYQLEGTAPLAFSPNGDFLVSAVDSTSDLELQLWSIDTSSKSVELYKQITLDNYSQATNLAFNEVTGQLGISTNTGYSILLMDIPDGTVSQEFRSHSGAISGLDFNPLGGGILVSSGLDNKIAMFRINNHQTIQSVTTQSDPTVIMFSPVVDSLLVFNDCNTLVVWSTVVDKEIAQLDEHEDCIKYITYSPNGEILISIDEGNRILVWDVNNYSLLFDLPTTGTIQSTFFSRDGRTLIVIYEQGILEFWNVNSMVESQQFSSTTNTEAIASVAANSDWSVVIKEFDGVEMVLVPPGCFQMGRDDGDKDESPRHEQCFNEPFWIDRYEVTEALWGTRNYLGPNYPVLGVDWYMVDRYCRDSRGLRLPTEMEWEYAARGPSNYLYPWGDIYIVGNAAVTERVADGAVVPVGSFPNGSSWVGAFDLSGNVWEWTSSIYDSYPYEENDGRENLDDASSLRVLRGGAWDYDPNVAILTNRIAHFPNVWGNNIGVLGLQKRG